MNAVARKKGLGRGLEALLGGSADITRGGGDRRCAECAASRRKCRPASISRARAWTRRVAGAGGQHRAQGVMQPILVRPVSADKYEIIAGRAAFSRGAPRGLEEVPVLVKDACPISAAAAMALIENIQREDLNPLEEAQGIQRLLDEFDFTHEQAAESVGRSRSAVSNLLRLLNLARPFRRCCLPATSTWAHARALLAVDASDADHAGESGRQQADVRCAKPRSWWRRRPNGGAGGEGTARTRRRPGYATTGRRTVRLCSPPQ